MEIGFASAFVGGLLTLLSPCSAMLLPAFFSYAFTTPAQVVRQTGVFYLGLVTTLVPLGVLAGTLGSLVNQYRDTVVTVAAIIVIALGVVMLLGISVPGFSTTSSTTASTTSVYALGTVYGLAGVCAGPLLGAVLTLATVTSNALYGGIVLLIFAAGMALPLLLLALMWRRLPFVHALIRPREVHIGRWRNTWTSIVGGLLTVAVGVLLLATKGTATISGVLGASDQARLEGEATEITESVPDLLVLAVAVLLGAVGWAYAHRRAGAKRP